LIASPVNGCHQTRQRLLKRPVADAGDLAALSVDELRDLADRLERDLIASPRSLADRSAATTSPNESSRIGDRRRHSVIAKGIETRTTVPGTFSGWPGTFSGWNLFRASEDDMGKLKSKS
jgi:hypothetical protein